MVTLNGYEVKVGDRLWSVMHGEFGEVVNIRGYLNLQFSGTLCLFHFGGSYTQNGPQIIFWDKIELGPPPPKPKRKVKKYRALLRLGKDFDLSFDSFATLEEVKNYFGSGSGYEVAYEALCLIPETEQEFDE